jgi:uncharacterized protein YraI
MREGTLLGGRGRTLIIVACLLAALWLPQSAHADTNLTIGGTAVISYANGDDVRLRESPGYDAGIIDLYPEGTVVEVRDGPTGADGSLWYRVSINGVRGYMVSDFLAIEGSASSGDTTVLDDLNLRAGPSTSGAVILVMPTGSMVWVTGSPQNGFYPVDYAGTAGWAHGDYLDVSGGGTAASNEGTATVTSELNLRAGPSTSETVLMVMPTGAVVTLTGGAENGFVSVDYAGMSGWAFADYLGLDGSPTASTGTATVIDGALNLRDGPSTSAGIITVMPDGAVVEVLGGNDNGFTPVRYNGSEGWAFADYLSTGSGNARTGPGTGNSGGLIVWPMSGGEWYISQGYNGPYSHYNSGSSYQYYYSFDLAQTDGGSAGTPIYSPVSGTVRWTEAGSGGMSIDMGNGYAFALFHVTVDSGLGAGDSVSQGQYVGSISGPGGDGYMGFEHVHISLWQTSDGGNWSRNAVPFTGDFAISGWDFPDVGGSNQHADTVFYP